MNAILDPHRVQALVIGGSAGGIEALLQLLPALPADCPIPVVVLVHLPDGHYSLLPDVFAPHVALPVKEADEKEALSPGTLYFAPPGYHLLIERNRTFSLSTEPPVHYSRPAIDVLFETAADAYGPTLAALLLTGANEDGAAGLAQVTRHGGTVLVQDPAEARIPTMPLAGLRATGGQAIVLPLASLALALRALRPEER
ncbi:chemotaxis protein CheB [Chitiniphilus shinanonensis]|uniref:protein-glutamate methylesterase n=1 Tax=Chitiniphilus shinanonensis TaxID=553088 RepID=A0ABQ6BTE4_9NEIS|nr:chemotaxis protein CheB [Chitiniphilus shinanonensis]GLS05273.1 chemotaxis protein CheB [Chitiniphilus shinanonensis]